MQPINGVEKTWCNQLIFVILEVQFHHEQGLSETRYLKLFLSMVYIFTMPKINLR